MSDMLRNEPKDLRLILPMPGNEAFAERLADAGGWELGRFETRQFPDGETYVRLLSDVAGRDVDLVCTLAQPDVGFLRLLFAADAARSLGARSVTLVAPYLAYMRQDKSFMAGEAVTSKTFARVVSSIFDGLVTVDPHLHRYGDLSELYSIPSQTLHAAPFLADWISSHMSGPLILGPDEESEQWVSAIATQIGAPHAVLRKIRHGDRNVDVELPDLSQWQDRTPVLVDDIASSGHTLVEAALKLLVMGYRRPTCVVVHGVFADESYQRLKAVTHQIVSSDSIPHLTNDIWLAPLIAEALKRHGGASSKVIRKRRPCEQTDGVGDIPSSVSPSS